MTRALGEKIVEALTKNQLEHLLECFFHISDVRQMENLFGLLDEDVKETVSRLMQTGETPEAPILSDEKLIERWNGLWDDWHSCTDDLGDEEGRYADQDFDWEPPFFNSYRLAEDLEKIAEQMLPLLEEIYQLGVEPDDLFEHELQTIQSGIHSFPDWMGVESGDPCVLESAATLCVLAWQWLTAESPEAFILTLRGMQDDVSYVDLNHGQFVEFFAGLPENMRKAVYAYLSSNREEPAWQGLLQNVHSRWHEVYHLLRAAFDPDGYLMDCRSLLSVNWKYGIPALEDLMSKRDFAEADRIASQTVTSFLRLGDDKEWKPEKSLLICHSRYPIDYGHPSEAVTTVLKHWTAASEHLKMAEKTAILKFQLAVYEHPHEWHVVLDAYRELKGSPFAKTITRLLCQWIDLTCQTYRPFGFQKNTETYESWLAYLLETIFDSTKDAEWFLNKARNWLQEISGGPASLFRQQKSLLFLLTCDLEELYGLRETWPKLLGEICLGHDENRKLTQSRHTSLRQVNADRLIAPLVECWKKCAAHLVPAPADVRRADYTTHALWLDVVREINPEVYMNLIERWQIDHRRRTNLWKAIRARDLPH